MFFVDLCFMLLITLEFLTEFVILLFNSMLYCCTSVPLVRTGTEPKESKPNGSLFGFDFLGTDFLRKPKNRTDQFG
jgi:flagellar biosynthesis protein FliP